MGGYGSGRKCPYDLLKDTHLGFYVPAEQYDFVAKKAYNLNISISEYLRNVIYNEMKKDREIEK